MKNGGGSGGGGGGGDGKLEVGAVHQQKQGGGGGGGADIASGKQRQNLPNDPEVSLRRLPTSFLPERSRK